MVKSERDELALSVWDEARDTGTGWWRANCPFCIERTGKYDHRRSFAILAGVGIYLCWKCGISSRLRNPPSWFVDLADAPEEFKQADRQAEIEPPEDWSPLWEEPGLTAECLRPARRYLKRRGFGPQLWEDAQIGACLEGVCRNRVVVPILGDDGVTWLGWVARWFEKVEPERKYLYPRGMPRGELLYQQHLLAVQTDEPAMVVEGVFDALPYWGTAVAVLGKPSHTHVDLLSRSARPLAVCLDGDAWEEAETLSQRLSLRGVRAGFVRLPPRTDPNSVDPGWLREEVLRCIP